MNIALLSAVEQRRLLGAREISAAQLLEACVAQYEKNNPKFNAIVETDLVDARTRAADADRALLAGEAIGPLHGLPMTVKDSVDWAGMPSTWGDPAHADHRPTEDADVVKQLRAAGAVLYGKSNVPLHLGDWQTHNEIHGLTSNPWDPARTAGGSSGGSAVSVATGMSSLEVGSDIGGSIRWPASYNGVAGLKPSFQLVSSHGHTFPGHEGTVDNNVVGPTARTVADLAMALPTMWQPHMCPRSADKESLADFRVGVLLDNPTGAQDTAVTGVLERAIRQLADAGVQLVDPPPLDFVLSGHEAGLMAIRTAAQGTATDRPSFDDVERYDRGDRDFDALVAKAAHMTYREWIDVNNQRERARLRWRDYFAGVDLLLTPVSATTAPPHDVAHTFGDQLIMVNGVRRPAMDQWFWAGIANATYLPALAIPAGIASDGLPVGMQVLGPFMGDLLTLGFGVLAEQVLGHPVLELHGRLEHS
ncbi:MAG: amidase family protein [Acidimicrobiales bacterium]